ncbi:MAG: prepilin-type N-terminal cleavage/methylation domain-containing protein [Kiritimatiellae bacterium]|nr:prepilin-type N-terminal cleavage/methylation domain-containing protein [Kiritimatiellia bacterium]
MAGRSHTLMAARRGFTLIEIVIVLFILALLALVAVPRCDQSLLKAKETAARHDLTRLREAFLGTADLPGYLADMEGIPGFTPVNPFAGERRFECLNLRVHNLFCPSNLQSRSELRMWQEAGLVLPVSSYTYDSQAGRGWRGPYLQGGREIATTGPSGRRPPPPPVEAGRTPPTRFPRLGRFPGPDERRFEHDQTFFERGFYRVNDVVPGSSDYGFIGEFALADPWGNPYVVQLPVPEAFPITWQPETALDKRFARIRWRYARLVSAGPDGILSTPRDLCAGRERDSLAARGDDLVLFLNRADEAEVLDERRPE